MTNEEAVKQLLDAEHCLAGHGDLWDVDMEAFETAIKALKQKPILDKIRAEIEQLPTTKCTSIRRIYMDADDFKKNVLVILDKYKAESEEV